MPGNILIIKPSSLGDVIHALPVLARLRNAFPAARISWLVGTQAAPLVESNRQLDRVFYFRRRSGGPVGTIKAGLSLARELSRENFDCVVDLQGLLRSALFAWAAGAPRRLGLADAREGAGLFYTETAKVSPNMHAVDRYLKVCELLDPEPGEALFFLEAPAAARRSVARILDNAAAPLPRPYIALSPGARWPTKVWPPTGFCEAARSLRDRFGGTFFLVGTDSEAGRAGGIIEREMGDGVVNLIGRTSLDELVALFARLDLVITPDTGLLHMADALAVPLVAVFGPTDPVRTGPYFQRTRVVTSNACEKAPCLRRKCPLEYCKAMAAVSGDQVYRRAAAVLEGED